VTEILRFLPAAVTVVFLAAMWRHGFRGEATRIVLAALALYAGSHAARATSGFPAVLTAVTSAVTCALIIILRKTRDV